MNFTKSVELKSFRLHIKVSGFFNETADFGVYDFSKIRYVNIDFADFELINSRGIMTWIRWFHEALLTNKDLKINFSNCPRVLIDQFNLIGSLLPKGAKIFSFLVPLRCPQCGNDIMVTYYEGKEFVLNSATGAYDIAMTSVVCSDCGASVTSEAVPPRYFQFLRSKR